MTPDDPATARKNDFDREELNALRELRSRVEQITAAADYGTTRPATYVMIPAQTWDNLMDVLGDLMRIDHERAEVSGES